MATINDDRTQSGVGGGYEIMQGYKIGRKVFSTADVFAGAEDMQDRLLA
jgi:hypothetical protein